MSEREQQIRYLLVGGWNTAFGYGLFVLLHWWLGTSLHYVLLLLICQVAATLNAFVGYRYLVFQVRGTWLLDLARFSLVYIGVYVANLLLLPLLVEVVGLDVLVAQAVIVFGTVVASFFAHRDFSFRRSDQDSPDRRSEASR